MQGRRRRQNFDTTMNAKAQVKYRSSHPNSLERQVILPDHDKYFTLRRRSTVAPAVSNSIIIG